MRTKIAMILLPVVGAAGIWLAAMTDASAASVGGAAIGEAAKAASIVHQVPCRVRRYCDWRGCRRVRRCW